MIRSKFYRTNASLKDYFKNKKNQNPKINESMLFFLLPILAYSVSYFYNVGVAFAYKFPIEYISIDFTSIFVTFLYILLIGAFSLHGINLMLLKLNGLKKTILKNFEYLIPVFIFNIILVALYINNIKYVLFYIFGTTTIIIIDLLVPFITKNKSLTYQEKVIEQRKIELGENLILQLIINLFGRKTIKFSVFILIFFYFTFSLGHSISISKKEYLVLENNQKFALVAKYSETLIFEEYDLDNKTFIKNFKIIKIGENSLDTLILKKVGPLEISD